jgi:hypothetical protein
MDIFSIRNSISWPVKSVDITHIYSKFNEGVSNKWYRFYNVLAFWSSTWYSTGSVGKSIWIDDNISCIWIFASLHKVEYCTLLLLNYANYVFVKRALFDTLYKTKDTLTNHLLMHRLYKNFALAIFIFLLF